MIEYPKESMVLMALVPSSRRMGYGVLKEPDDVFEWGVKKYDDSYDDKIVVDAIGLLDKYRPDMLLMEDTTDGELKRGDAARDAIFHIYAAAMEHEIAVEAVMRNERDAVFMPRGATTKYEVAAVLGEVFPELSNYVPEPRKLWESEHHHVPMFEAFALILTYCETCREEMPDAMTH